MGRRRGGRRLARAAQSSAEELRTPHSGYHYTGLSDRFFEGWYFRVTIPEIRKSFAFIYSVEDPGNPNSKQRGVGVQVMGPSDGYVTQYTKSTDRFWADPYSLALGTTLQTKPFGTPLTGMTSAEEFDGSVKYGFQTNSTWNQGSIRSVGVVPPGSIRETVDTCRWAYNTTPTQGWGDAQKQEATAGWAAVLPIFEPHWQVLMANGKADGWIEWGDERYEFKNAPTYAEKNWGKGFPAKWFWVQCNAFKNTETEEDTELSLTAVGALRELPGISESLEEVGMIGLHYDGDFIALTPRDSIVTWTVDEWGRWEIQAERSADANSDTDGDSGLRAEVLATCAPRAGTPLRAPTPTNGLFPVCKDTFEGHVRVRLWKDDSLVLDATSDNAGLEIGGGPWDERWRGKAELTPVVRALWSAPVDIERVFEGPLASLRPPGL